MKLEKNPIQKDNIIDSKNLKALLASAFLHETGFSSEEISVMMKKVKNKYFRDWHLQFKFLTCPGEAIDLCFP